MFFCSWCRREKQNYCKITFKNIMFLRVILPYFSPAIWTKMVKLFLLHEIDHTGWCFLTKLQKFTRGPEYLMEIATSLLRTLDLVLLWWQENHDMFSTIWAGEMFLPLDKGIHPAFLPEVQQLVHCRQIIVDQNLMVFYLERWRKATNNFAISLTFSALIPSHVN